MPASAQKARGQESGAISAAVRQFLEEHPTALVMEAGETLFSLREASYEIDESGGRTLLHLWSPERNVVRRLTGATRNGRVLRLVAQRLGARQTSVLEIFAEETRLRLASGRQGARQGFAQRLERVLTREFPAWRVEGTRSSMDLEHSFGPAFARGLQVRGQRAWVFAGVSGVEPATVVEGVLSVALLWMVHARERAGARRVVVGLRVIVPRGQAAVTQARMAWLDERLASYELYELDEVTEELRRCDPYDRGNLATRLLRAPDAAAALRRDGRFAEALPQVLSLLPEASEDGEARRASELPSASAGEHGAVAVFAARGVELRLRSGAELAFLRFGLEFARVRLGYAGGGFNRRPEVTVGSGAHETRLTPGNAAELRAIVRELFARRSAELRADRVRERTRRSSTPGMTKVWPGRAPSRERETPEHYPVGDPLFRQQPERWLESLLRADLPAIDASLCREPVYVQVGALAGAGDRGTLDLLALTHTGRLAVVEVKTDEDLHLAMQGLDYWIRVQHHHLANVDRSTGLGDLQRQGYFPEARLSSELPLLLLVAPALHIHPATEVILRHLHPAVEWRLIALDERWRTRLRPVWRRGARDRTAGPARQDP